MRLVTAEEVARVLGIKTRAVYRYGRLGYLPAVRIGTKLVRFDLDRIEQSVAEGFSATALTGRVNGGGCDA